MNWRVSDVLLAKFDALLRERDEARADAAEGRCAALYEAIWTYEAPGAPSLCRGCDLSRVFCETQRHHDYCPFGRALSAGRRRR